MESNAKYDKIGTGYNASRQADPYLADRLLHFLQPRANGLYADIGCGTGNYTIALSDRWVNIYGVDPSEKMLDEARKRSNKITWIKGTAEHMPLEDNLFNGVIASLTIHHWTNLNNAFLEISRVLTGKGRMVLFTSTPGQMKGYWLNHYFPKMLHDSIIQMPSLHNVSKAAIGAGLEVTGIERYFVKDDLRDHFLYVGKNRPELYFNEQVRSGISSFASLANSYEVETGLQRLGQDLADRSFEAVKHKYSNELGDYVFVIIEKKGPMAY